MRIINRKVVLGAFIIVIGALLSRSWNQLIENNTSITSADTLAKQKKALFKKYPYNSDAFNDYDIPLDFSWDYDDNFDYPYNTTNGTNHSGQYPNSSTPFFRSPSYKNNAGKAAQNNGSNGTPSASAGNSSRPNNSPYTQESSPLYESSPDTNYFENNGSIDQQSEPSPYSKAILPSHKNQKRLLPIFNKKLKQRAATIQSLTEKRLPFQPYQSQKMDTNTHLESQKMPTYQPNAQHYSRPTWRPFNAQHLAHTHHHHLPRVFRGHFEPMHNFEKEITTNNYQHEKLQQNQPQENDAKKTISDTTNKPQKNHFAQEENNKPNETIEPATTITIERTQNIHALEPTPPVTINKESTTKPNIPEQKAPKPTLSTTEPVKPKSETADSKVKIEVKKSPQPSIRPITYQRVSQQRYDTFGFQATGKRASLHLFESPFAQAPRYHFHTATPYLMAPSKQFVSRATKIKKIKYEQKRDATARTKKIKNKNNTKKTTSKTTSPERLTTLPETTPEELPVDSAEQLATRAPDSQAEPEAIAADGQQSSSAATAKINITATPESDGPLIPNWFFDEKSPTTITTAPTQQEQIVKPEAASPSTSETIPQKSQSPTLNITVAGGIQARALLHGITLSSPIKKELEPLINDIAELPEETLEQLVKTSVTPDAAPSTPLSPPPSDLATLSAQDKQAIEQVINNIIQYRKTKSLSTVAPGATLGKIQPIPFKPQTPLPFSTQARPIAPFKLGAKPVSALQSTVIRSVLKGIKAVPK